MDTVRLKVVSEGEELIQKILAVTLILTASTSVSGSGRVVPSAKQEQCSGEHEAWVGQVLLEMKSIQAGMTRKDLLKTFTTEGGFSTRLNRRFVSRDCPYFKVDVKFRAMGQPETDSEGRVTLVEDPRDVIVEITQPFLEFSIKD
jgi:hypothetical protein